MHGTVSSSILLKDVEYIEIEGLEITNDRGTKMILKVIKPIMMRTVWTEPVLPESQKTKEH